MFFNLFGICEADLKTKSQFLIPHISSFPAQKSSGYGYYRTEKEQALIFSWPAKRFPLSDYYRSYPDRIRTEHKKQPECTFRSYSTIVSQLNHFHYDLISSSNKPFSKNFGSPRTFEFSKSLILTWSYHPNLFLNQGKETLLESGLKYNSYVQIPQLNNQRQKLFFGNMYKTGKTANAYHTLLLAHKRNRNK